MASLTQLKIQESQDLDPQFGNFIKQTKERLTYQVLADLQSLNKKMKKQNKEDNSQQDQKIDQIKLNKQIQVLMKEYNDSMKVINNIQYESMVQYLKEMLQERQNKADQYYQEIKNQLILQRLEAQTKLNKQLQKINQNIKKYLQKLCLRIKHNNYQSNQRQIQDYIGRQKQCVQNRKKEIQTIIRQRNKQIRQMVNVAIGVCKDKQSQINQLNQTNTQLKNSLQHTKQTITKLNDSQKQYYQQISNLTQQILLKKAQKKNSSKQNKNNQSYNSSQPNHNFDQNRNLGSVILPQRSSDTQNSSIIIPGEASASSSTKCQIEQTDFPTQLNAKKIPLLFLLILSVLLYFW